MNENKIICTLGPATSSYEKILQLIDAGMNVAQMYGHGAMTSKKRLTISKKRARKRVLAIA